MKVYKYGANVDTDVIIPARHLNDPSPAALASHCMEDIDKDFASTVQPGDIIVAGPNFGCGSSREHAPLAIKSCRVKCVIAPSFARIFYRNAINIGFPIMECAQAAEEIQAGDQVDVDFDSGVITDKTTGKTYQAAPFPEFIDGIIKSGGLLNSLKDRGWRNELQDRADPGRRHRPRGSGRGGPGHGSRGEEVRPQLYL